MPAKPIYIMAGLIGAKVSALEQLVEKAAEVKKDKILAQPTEKKEVTEKEEPKISAAEKQRKQR